MTNPKLSVSTWSLHKKLGLAYHDAADGATRIAKESWGPGDCTLLDIPAQAAAHGIGKLEICHFHYPSTDPGYIADLRGALVSAGVQMLTLLIDEGDITAADPVVRERHLANMLRWVDVAAASGGQRARVIAGDAAPDAAGEALRLSAAGLKRLSERAMAGGVRLTTENWHPLLDKPAELIALMEMMDGQLGLCLDFGNWPGERKYTDLPQIARYAESTHAKAQFAAEGQMDQADFVRCLEICKAAGFNGPHSLIFDGPGDEWTSLDQIRDVVRPYLNA